MFLLKGWFWGGAWPYNSDHIYIYILSSFHCGDSCGWLSTVIQVSHRSQERWGSQKKTKDPDPNKHIATPWGWMRVQTRATWKIETVEGPRILLSQCNIAHMELLLLLQSCCGRSGRCFNPKGGGVLESWCEDHLHWLYLYMCLYFGRAQASDFNSNRL